MVRTWEFEEEEVLPDGRVRHLRRMAFEAATQEAAMAMALEAVRRERPDAELTASGIGVWCGRRADGGYRVWYLLVAPDLGFPDQVRPPAGAAGDKDGV